ncbi:MAG: hypothetical protein HC910_21560 [Spirulinaceae cyanobacterium SM2_1_0]|nr:hypothetical protein [Spirulinaceae cyanobacterium SM2_1_0]
MQLDLMERMLISGVFYDALDGKLDNASAALMLGQVLVAKATQELAKQTGNRLPDNYYPPVVNR